MGAFRFRAEAALDLRHRQEKDALAARGRAQARFIEANRALDAELRRREAARAELVGLERAGSTLDAILWHRNWIVRLAANLDAIQRAVYERAQEVQAADQAWHDARRRRLADPVRPGGGVGAGEIFPLWGKSGRRPGWGLWG